MPQESNFPTSPQAIVCNACNGDPRASVNCKQCRGAGVGIPSEYGFLIWNTIVDDFTAAIRKFRIKVNAAIHLMVLAIIIAFVAIFFWNVIRFYSFQDLQTISFWSAGYWFVSLFYLAIVFTAFFIFRISEFTKPAKELPNWLPHKDLGQTQKQTALEVSPYFSEPAMEVIESAYKIAKDTGRVEISPVILFSAVLASRSGALFMARLGMRFENVKDSLAQLIQTENAGSPPITFSREAKRTLVAAFAYANQTHRKYVSPMEIFLQAFLDSEKLQDVLDRLEFPPSYIINVAKWVLLHDKLREDHERFTMLARFKPKTSMNRAMTAMQTPLLDRYSEDLTLLALRGYLSPMIGNQKVMDDLLRGLESGQQSVVLVGETGCGKAAVIEQLARQMVEEEVPELLFDKRLVSVNLAQVVAAGDPGLAAERLLAMLHEVAVSGNIVLALYGIEALVGGGSGPMDLAETFASELDKGYFTVVATTSQQSWTQYLERRSLGKKLVKVVVPPADAEQTVQVLMAKSGTIEYKNQVYLSYAALEKAATLSLRYLHDVAAPQSALNVLRESAVLVRKSRGEGSFVTAEDVAKIVHDKTDIPVEMVTKEESRRLLDLEDRMHGRVIGQDDAVKAVAQAMRRARAELREGKRPIANFLFLGPTGVGKTETAKTLAQEYFGDENAMIRLDMSEYQEQMSVTRMIGFPQDERGGLLTEAVRKKPFTIVLLDEIEKAHPDVLTLFLQVMDDGRLTDGVGRVIDFTNAVIIMTSNAGTSYIQNAIAQGKSAEQIKTVLLERELKGIFRPEFLNRFDNIIVFKPLTRDQVVQIAWLMLGRIAKNLEAKGIRFRAEDPAVEDLADAGFDPAFGARPLRRVIQDRVDTNIADLLLKQEVDRHDTIVLHNDGTLHVEKAANPLA
ncbi:ATP-dependent Clp protease ATP-binding subunit [Patescibacteria group bacterium]|nr:ATP-dependent Clp protease ATP-binding subunit [Patescibacteria group bacterium]